jgi:hypothetical protein
MRMPTETERLLVGVDPFLDLLASQSKRDRKTNKKTTVLALAPAIEPNGPGTREVCTPDGVARHEHQAFAKEEKNEIVVDPVTKNYLATRLDEKDHQEELEDNSDSYVFPGAIRMGGRNDYTSAPNQAESLEVGLPPPAPCPQQPFSCKRSSPRI